MSLSKRLSLLITLLFTLVFIGTLSISISNTKNYLNQQLQISSQNTATSLSKLAAEALVQKDIAKLQTLVDANFDSGFYRSIRVRDVNGVTLVVREVAKVQIKNVPEWFVNTLTLKAPEGQQEIISSQFSQLGTLTVSAHPGLAYKELWDTFTDNVWWLSFVALVSFLSVFMVLRYLLSPLALLEEQANEIATGNFVVQERLPSTPELHSITDTMNKMSVKVCQMLEAQTELTERMRERAYLDPLTGLKNRRYFAEQMAHLLKTPEEIISGALILIELSEFKAYNQQLGYVKADELLKKIADVLTLSVLNISGVCLARVSGASFAILAPNISLEDTKDTAARIHKQLEPLHHKGKIDDITGTHIGVAYYDGHQDSTELLSMADLALRAAQIKGSNHWHIYGEQNLTHDKVRSATDWKQFMQNMISAKNFELHYQPVRRVLDNELMHYEVLARIPDGNGKLITASTFLPMAERFGLATGVDLVVIEKLIETIGDENQLQYAVNLSRASLEDEKFLEWLKSTLSQYPARAKSIIFETPEYGLKTNLNAMHESIRLVRELGCSFSLDHFGTGSADFGYLLNTKIDYIKVDGSYVRGLDHNDDNCFFVKSITDIAHGLDIQVIAEYVETEAEWKMLRKLNIDGGQGHYVGKPYPDIAPDTVLNESVGQ